MATLRARRQELVPRSRRLRFESLEERQLLSATAVDDPLRVVSTSPALDQGPIAPISSLEVTFNKPIDASTFQVEDVGLVDLSIGVSPLGAFADGDARGGAVQGTLLYAAAGSALQVVDISDPTLPRLVAWYGTPGQVNSVVLVGNLAYVAEGTAGIEIFDISKPTAAVRLGRFDTLGSAENIEVVGARAYVADGVDGVAILDVSDPAAPAELLHIDIIMEGTTSYRVGSSLDVEVVGDRLYVAQMMAGMLIFDVADLENVSLLGQVYAWGASSVEVVDDIAYITVAERRGFQIVDVSDPTSYSWFGLSNTPQIANDVRVVGNYAYVAAGDAGLFVYDVADPRSASLVAQHNTPDTALGVTVMDHYAYLADAEAGIQILDVVDPRSPARVGSYEMFVDLDVADVSTSGNRAYLAAPGYGIQILDISSPASPTFLGGYSAPGTARGLQVVHDVAYLADGDRGLQVVDVSHPTAPTLLSEYDTPGSALDVELADHLAFVADGDAGVQVLDVADLSTPVLLGTYAQLSYAWHAELVGSRLYVADGAAGLRILDVTSPAAPVLLGQYDTAGETRSVKVVGDLAYVADWDGGLLIIDISDPAAPVRIGGSDTLRYASDLEVVGGLAYVADWKAGIQIFDISDPSAPARRDGWNTYGYAARLDVAGNLVYLAYGQGGMQAVQVGQAARSITPLTPTTWRIEFAQPLKSGAYTLLLGPELLDLDGYLMNQNRDSVPGDGAQDAFGVRFVVSHVPTDITLSASTIPENRPAGTSVGRFATTDPDVGDTFLLRLAAGEGDSDNASFTIDSAGNLLALASFDYESKQFYSIRVRTTDQAGLWYEEQFTITVADVHEFDSPGLFDARNSLFYLRNSNSTGAADDTFGYGDPAQSWTELVGDWNGDGADGIGFFDPATSTWYLRNSLTAGYADWTFGYGDPLLTTGHADRNWKPIVGDWDGNGTDTIGFFDPATSTWYLRNSLTAGYADWTFGCGDPLLTTGHADRNWQPIVGNWDGAGGDSIGFFDPASCTWYLRNALSAGYADYTFGCGDPSRLVNDHGGATWQPLVGDWDGNGSATIGFFAPDSSTFMLRSSLTTGAADLTFGYGAPNAGWHPLVGCWNTTPGARAVDQLDLDDLADQALDPTVALYTPLA
jgi:hypothetical protein